MRTLAYLGPWGTSSGGVCSVTGAYISAFLFQKSTECGLASFPQHSHWSLPYRRHSCLQSETLHHARNFPWAYVRMDSIVDQNTGADADCASLQQGTVCWTDMLVHPRISGGGLQAEVLMHRGAWWKWHSCHKHPGPWHRVEWAGAVFPRHGDIQQDC